MERGWERRGGERDPRWSEREDRRFERGDAGEGRGGGPERAGYDWERDRDIQRGGERRWGGEPQGQGGWPGMQRTYEPGYDERYGASHGGGQEGGFQGGYAGPSRYGAYGGPSRFGGYGGERGFGERGPGERGYGQHEGWGGERFGGSYGRSPGAPYGFDRPVAGPRRGKPPKGYQRADERIRDEVCELIARESDVDASEVEVQVAQGEVTLSGTVEDRRSKRELEDLAERVFGVKDVHNQLKVNKSFFAEMGEKVSEKLFGEEREQPTRGSRKPA